MNKKSLESYFLEHVIPEVNRSRLSDSRKNSLSLSPREHLGLVLLSYLFRELNKRQYSPAINPDLSDDGCVYDFKDNKMFEVEQVYIYEDKWDQKNQEGILNALKSKSASNKQYSAHTTLLIFCNAIGTIYLNEINSYITSSKFKTIILFAPTGDIEYEFNACILKDDGKLINACYKLAVSTITGKATIKEIAAEIANNVNENPVIEANRECHRSSTAS